MTGISKCSRQPNKDIKSLISSSRLKKLFKLLIEVSWFEIELQNVGVRVSLPEDWTDPSKASKLNLKTS